MHYVPLQDEHYPGINPIALGWRNCQPGFKNGPHARPYWFLHYVISGRGTFWIEDRQYSLEAGHIFVIPPNIPATYQADTQEPWEYIWVGFTYPRQLPIYLPDVIECPSAMRHFSAMRICEKMVAGRSAFLCAQIWELLSHLMEKRTNRSAAIDQALSFIHAEYGSGLTTTDIARRLNMDRSYFSARFKKQVGVSPGKYLLDLRMNVAANMLASGSSVSATAAAVGYADIYVFSKMFKRVYGMSPTQYIKART